MSPPRKRILFAFPWYLAPLHEGALKYCAEKGWHTSTLTAANAELLAGEHHDGILSTLYGGTHPAYEFVAKAGLPVVELSEAYPEHPEWAAYPSDRVATGRMAADFLRRRPVASFAFVVPGRCISHEARREGFVTALAEAGDVRPVACFYAGDKGMIDYDLPSGAVTTDAVARRELIAFLESLPGPVGVFGSVDTAAVQVIEAAREAGMKVPGDIYLLGFGNRELLSRHSLTPISSVAIDYVEWGYAAMGLLDELMSGKTGPVTRRFPPSRVIERESTGGESGGDPLCAGALALMRDHVSRPLGVVELAAQLGVSKSKLNAAFAEAYGTGVAKRYLQLRLEVAKGLLTGGEKVESAATAVGFSSARSFRAAFVESTGMTPGDYARKAREG